jgi:hypothetical protein
VPVAVLPTAKSLSAFSLKPQSDRLLEPREFLISGAKRLLQQYPPLATKMVRCHERSDVPPGDIRAQTTERGFGFLGYRFKR